MKRFDGYEITEKPDGDLVEYEDAQAELTKLREKCAKIAYDRLIQISFIPKEVAIDVANAIRVYSRD